MIEDSHASINKPQTDRRAEHTLSALQDYFNEICHGNTELQLQYLKS